MGEIRNDDVVVLRPGTRILKKDGVDYFLLLNENLFSAARINRTTAEIVGLCNGINNIEDISKLLSEKYKVSLEQVREEVKQTIDRLLSLGLLIKIGEEEKPPREDFSISRGPIEVWLFVTNRCNLRCITCFKNAGNKIPNELSYDEIVKLIDEITSFSHPRMIISGGEPLLRKDLNKILSYIKDKGLYVRLITNGTLITKSIVEEWKSIGIDFVQVSLDGSKPEINDAIRGKGVFQRVINNISLLKEHGIKFSLYPTITKLNIEDVPSIIELFCSLTGRETFSGAFFGPIGRGSANKNKLSLSAEDYIQLMHRLVNDEKTRSKLKTLVGFESKLLRVPSNLTRKLNCGLGTATISIDSDGSVYPCHWLHLPEYRAGNIRTSSFREIYFNSEVLRKLRELRVDKLETCSNCPWRYICGGGCRALALFATGRIDGPDPYCKFYKYYFEHALWGHWD
jgi:radical SAM protein with 4Fe4S-binding SPASM domain